MWLKRLAINISLVFAGILAGVLLFEGYLRIFEKYGEAFTREDPFVGKLPIPNKTVRWRGKCYETRVTFNSQGFRDVEHTLEKPPGVYRVIVMGDSMIAALEVEDDETPPRFLEERLNTARLGKRFEAINLAVYGGGTSQEYLALKHYGFRYNPDLVILAFHINDLIDNNYLLDCGGPGNCPWKPYFDLDKDGNLVQLPMQVPPQPGPVRSALRSLRLYHWVGEKIQTIPRLQAFLWQFGVVRHAPRTTNAGGTPTNGGREVFGTVVEPGGRTGESPTEVKRAPDRRGDPPVRGAWSVEQETRNRKGAAEVPPHLLRFNPYLKQYHPDMEKSWRITKALVKKIRDESAQQGARFLLVHAPDVAQLVPAERIEGEYPDFQELRYDLTQPDNILREFAASEGMSYLSLLPVFREYLHTKNLPVEHLYHWCDIHWTPQGSRLAAEAIFQKIVADRLSQGSFLEIIETAAYSFQGRWARFLAKAKWRAVPL